MCVATCMYLRCDCRVNVKSTRMTSTSLKEVECWERGVINKFLENVYLGITSLVFVLNFNCYGIGTQSYTCRYFYNIFRHLKQGIFITADASEVLLSHASKNYISRQKSEPKTCMHFILIWSNRSSITKEN